MSSMYPSFGGAPSRPCTRCGTPLTINETQCSRCGTYNPLPQGQQFGMFPQGAQGGGPVGPSGPLWGGQQPPSPPYQQPGNGGWPGPGNQDASAPAWGSGGGQQAGGGWQQNNLFGGQDQSFPPAQPQQNNLFGSFNGSGFSGQNSTPYSNFQPNPNQSAFNGSGFQQNGSGFQQSAERPSVNSFFQATQQNGYGGSSPMAPDRPAWMKRPGDDDADDGGKGKNRPSAGVVVVIIILLVVVLGGGGYGGYYFWHHRNDGAVSTTTATGPVIVTPGTTPLFSDTFKNNSNGWSTTPPTGGKVTLAGNGKLILESDNNSLLPELLPGGKTFGDARVDVDAGLTSGDKGNGYGVYIRASSAGNSNLGLYYRFEVYGDGSFVIYKGSLDPTGKLASNSLSQSLQPSDAIARAGTLNHLTIIAKGQTMTFIVNNTAVAKFSDSGYKSGTVALFVSNVQKVPAGAQATFEHLAIFPAS